MWIKDIRDYILYEDKDILVCHKPAGLAVQNARVGNMDMESLLKNYIAQKVPGKMPYLGIIHRLDQPVESFSFLTVLTSGFFLFKNFLTPSTTFFPFSIIGLTS